MAQNATRVQIPPVLAQAAYQETIRHCVKVGRMDPKDLAQVFAVRMAIAADLTRELQKVLTVDTFPPGQIVLLDDGGVEWVPRP